MSAEDLPVTDPAVSDVEPEVSELKVSSRSNGVQIVGEVGESHSRNLRSRGNRTAQRRVTYVGDIDGLLAKRQPRG